MAQDVLPYKHFWATIKNIVILKTPDLNIENQHHFPIAALALTLEIQLLYPLLETLPADSTYCNNPALT